ncbi:hypothetical protein ACFFRR_001674 [Megaselia abdita]
MGNTIGNCFNIISERTINGDIELRQLFKDGQRTVDYVLAYDKSKTQNNDKRAIFEENLMKEGLELEKEETQKVHFVKIHAPTEVLSRFSEFLKLKLPLKTVKEQDQIVEPEFKLLGSIRNFFTCKAAQLDEGLFPPPEHTLLYEYSRDKKDLFDCKNLHSSTNRIAIIHFILERQRFSNEEHGRHNYGIEKLLQEGVYNDAYALHDGQFFKPGCERNLLLTEWGSANKWLKYQPLDNVKDYFGPKIALYFAWLGFYTRMLIPPSIIGIIGVIYGWSTLSSDRISNDICDKNNSFLMCPQCDKDCDFWFLNKTCTSSKFNYVIDNNYTVFYALFMSIWAVLYLEMWKRYSAKLIHRWGLTDFSSEVEHARPQYLERLKNSQCKRYNADANVLEPHAPFWRIKFPSYFLSYSIVLLFISLAIITFCSLIVYRMAQRATSSFLSNQKFLLHPVTAGVLDLLVITCLDYIYTNYLAAFLTNLEYRRTETEYQESLTIKNYLFQFFNYYSSLFYIAFLKGKFVGYPKKYNKIFGVRQEECNPGGCLMELSIQLAIIMIGKQIVNEVLELSLPYFKKTISRIKNTMGLSRSAEEEKLLPHNQWTEDYHLLPWTNNSLFLEYLEMVLQFGFITIFGLAFPLAPLFALMNNAFELRMDAMKLLKFYKRPNPQRTNNIGVWFSIMSVVTKIAVASTAFIIAFSSNLIPKLVYMTDKYIKATTNTTDLNGYLNWTLARFNTSDYPEDSSFSLNVTTCRYAEFRNPPEFPENERYKRPLIYWKILAARLAFLVIFQNIVGMIQTIVAWAIPDTPLKLNDEIKREKLLIHETLMEEEKKKIVELASKCAANGSTQHEIINEYNVHPDGEIVRRRVYGRPVDEDTLYPLQEDRTSAV